MSSPAFLKVLAAGFGVLALAPSLWAQSRTAREWDHSQGCGKAYAATIGFESETASPVIEPRGSDTMEDTDVLHNELDIEVFPETGELAGSNTFTIQSKSNALDEFTFRLRDSYIITEVLINGDTPIDVRTEGITTRVAELDRTYGMDEIFTLTVSYEGTPVSLGFGSINFIEASDEPLVFTLSEPYYAYSWRPAKDGDFGAPGDNSDKATYEISITAPSGLTSVSNGLLVGTEVLTDPARIRYTYATDYDMSTYLACFSTGKYNTWNKTYISSSGKAMPVNFYVTPDLDTTNNRDLWNKSVDMLSVFADLFGEYPFIEEKYGIYYFGFGGGMEHQTMTGQSAFYESLTAHELAHQWFGDMITCKTWQDIWLNEGFASYSEALWEEFKSGESDADARQDEMNFLRPFDVEGSVYVPEDELDNVYRIFSGTYSYDKAAWVLHMLRGVIGDDAFFDMIQEYRAAFAFKAATTEEFIDVCEAVYGDDLRWYFDQWVYGVGAPQYSLGWTAEELNGRYFIKLSLYQTQSILEQDPFTMPIDIEVTTESGVERFTIENYASKQNYILETDDLATDVVIDPDEWILETGKTVGGPYEPSGPVVMVSSPLPGDIIDITNAPAAVTFTFDSEISSQANYYSVIGEATGGKAFEHAYDADTRTVSLRFTSVLEPDHYTVTASRLITGAANGLALDGEVSDPTDSHALPSGNGIPSGDLLFEFDIIGTLPEPVDEEPDSGDEPTTSTEPEESNDGDGMDAPDGGTMTEEPNANAEVGSTGAGPSPSGSVCGVGMLSAGSLALMMVLAMMVRRLS